VRHATKQSLISGIVKLLEDQYDTKISHQDPLRSNLINTINDALDESSTSKLQDKNVTILLSDLRGFTAMAEKYSALELIEVLNSYFLKMSQVIQKYGGTIDKFMGDAIMVLFGAPDSADDDLERCLACAIEMQIAMSEFNIENQANNYPPLFMGIGINTGHVVAGNLGSYIHTEYTVIGDEVNLASRVEAHSLRGQILISESCYQQAQSYIEIGDENSVRVKGKTKPVILYELISTNRPKELTTPRSEVRKSPRIEMDAPLAFHCLDGKDVLPTEHMGRIIDVSYGGIFAVTDVALEPFQEVVILLSLSLMSHQSTEIYAKIIRVNKLDNKYEFNLEFTSIDEKGQQALKDFVDQQIERK
jgi:adenylate cyclase